MVAWFAEHGVGDTSLRTLATGIGTSHRMLNYHFGSREGLLGAVVEAVEQAEHAALVELAATHDDPFEAGAAFWTRVADRAEVFAPLFFELSTHAMRGSRTRTGCGPGCAPAGSTPSPTATSTSGCRRTGPGPSPCSRSRWPAGCSSRWP